MPCESRRVTPIWDGVKPLRASLQMCSTTSSGVVLSHVGGARRYGSAEDATEIGEHTTVSERVSQINTNALSRSVHTTHGDSEQNKTLSNSRTPTMSSDAALRHTHNFYRVEEKRMMDTGIVRRSRVIRGLPCAIQPITSHTIQWLIPTILQVPRPHKYEDQHRQ